MAKLSNICCTVPGCSYCMGTGIVSQDQVDELEKMLEARMAKVVKLTKSEQAFLKHIAQFGSPRGMTLGRGRPTDKRVVISLHAKGAIAPKYNRHGDEDYNWIRDWVVCDVDVVNKDNAPVVTRSSMVERADNSFPEVEVLRLTKADNKAQLLECVRSWMPAGSVTMKGDRMFFKGNEVDREFVKGFVYGWRSALRNN